MTSHYGWDHWNGDWKIWWGDVLGSDSLRQSGMDQKKKGNLEFPKKLEKSKSVEDVSLIGVGGGKVGSFHASSTVIKDPIIPDYKRPTWERNKYDDEILRQSNLDGGSGSS